MDIKVLSKKSTVLVLVSSEKIRKFVMDYIYKSKMARDKSKETLMVKNILRIKEKRNMTNKMIAVKAQMSASRVAKILDVDKPPRLSTITRIASALNIPDAELMRTDIQEIKEEDNSLHYIRDGESVYHKPKKKKRAPLYTRKTIDINLALHNIVQYQLSHGNSEGDVWQVAEEMLEGKVMG